MDCSMPGSSILHYLPEFAQTYIHWVNDAVQPTHPLLPPSYPSIFPSIRVFSNESAICIRWPKCWNFSFSLSPSNEYSGLIFLRIEWFDLLAVQGTLKSLLQHHSSKVSVLWHSAFFMVQPSHTYMTSGKTTVLTIQTFVGKVISLLFNKLSRFVIAILPRSKCLNFVAAVTIHWFWSLRKMKSDTISTFSLSNCYEVIGPDAMILLFKCCFKPAFSLSSFTLIKRLFGSS